MRLDGLNFVQKLQQANAEVDEKELINRFGTTHASDPQNFRFEFGDKKLIRLIRDHLIKQKNEKGAKFMRRFRKQTGKKVKTHSVNLLKTDKHTDTQEQQHENDLVDVKVESTSSVDAVQEVLPKGRMTNEMDGVDCQELSAGLVQRVKLFMQKYGIDNSFIQKVTLNCVSVKIVDDLVEAEVFCAICQNSESKSRRKSKKKNDSKRVYYKGGVGSRYWVLSNLGSHFENVHKYNKPRALKQSKVSNIESTAHDNDEAAALAHNFSVEYVDVDTKVDSIENTMNPNASTLIFNEITTQLGKMLSATLSHNDETSQMYFHLIENESLSLKIANIPPDGSCLFGSIVHQLFAYKINSDDHRNKTKELRASVVDYISRNYLSFKYELQGRVYEDMNADLVNDLDKECRNIFETYLPLNDYYGGAETLKAVQEMLHVNIIAFYEQGTCEFSRPFNDAYTRTLILAYKLSNSGDEYDHYDSVYDISSNEILKSIEFLLNNLQKKEKPMIFDETL